MKQYFESEPKVKCNYKRCRSDVFPTQEVERFVEQFKFNLYTDQIKVKGYNKHVRKD